MSSTRALALRRIAASPRPLPRSSLPVASLRQARWESSKSKDGDLGGPGGQEPIPSKSGPSQSWPTLAAIAAVGFGVGSYLVHLTGKPKGSTTPEGHFDELAKKVVPGKMLPIFIALQAASYVAAGPEYNFTLHVSKQRPEWAEKLSPNLAGFSLEMDRWPDWAGQEVGKPNEYFNQLLRNLGERTGHMPFLRVGANSQDRATVDLSLQVMNKTFPQPTEEVPNPEADHIFIGRDFYALSGNLPAGTPFMWGLNLKALNKTETVIQARLLADTFQGGRANLTKNVHLMDVELGNEPDFYGPTRTGRNGPYGPEWDVFNYTDTWVKYAEAVSKEIEFGEAGSDKPNLSPGAFTGFNAPEWTPVGPLQAGLLQDAQVRANISQFTEHAYSGGFDPRRVVRPGELMSKVSVRNNMTTRTSGIRAVRSVGLDYVLAETNSYANHGQPGLSNTVESALWATDWLLLGASSGIQRLHFHHGVGFRYNLIQPTNDSDDGLNITHPHILPSYHAFLIVNEAIGKSGRAYVAEIATTNLTLTAYGIWEEEKLARIVVLNTQIYLGGPEKPSINVDVGKVVAGQRATVKFLVSDNTTSYTGLTWAGQSFETLSGEPSGAVVETDIENGRFNLPASSIALVNLESGH
ncbi:hypothetical protein CkaCkLH20_04267 [Colletotrichum karsti]|uniref:Beta-glucuronidase C-terminal domain-containing protein n=1 Tax=Colletotrichum karsti TaxID=1095194 RepID=A0A9P6I935_9PEZI|nr:uncharacterized protein CkaCkLH20_04267 [Colletotrichum karsti]KAF9878229.1 hypothetical protein CkaCkLH20_04267 [Colletotrichum karsti]